jgi:hypothetical protein
VIARVVAEVLLRPRRELWIGGSTVKAIVGQRIIPGLLDHYVARTCYDSQQTREPATNRPDNLDAPLPGDRGAHGRFGARARTRSLEVGLRLHAVPLLGAAALATAALLGLRALLRRLR